MEDDLFFYTARSARQKGCVNMPLLRGNGGMPNGPIRVKQVNQSSSVIGHINELASTTC